MKIQKKRRRQGKTDYKARMSLLKGAKPRIAVRKTGRYVSAQYIKSNNAQDYVVCSAHSKELLDYGWPESMKGSLKSLPACYLTGMLIAKRIIRKEGKNNAVAVLDIGLARNAAKSRIYAVLKGIVEGGGEKIIVPHKKESLPDDNRVRGAHSKGNIQEIFKSAREKIEKSADKEKNTEKKK